MRRLLPVLLALLVIACDGGGGSPPSGPTAQLRASFPAGGIVDTIVIDAVDRLPLRAADLIAPDGTATPASYINAVAAPQFAAGQWAAGNQWQNGLAGNNGAAASLVTHPVAGAAFQGETQLLATVSTADITLPDSVLYRRAWARYRIRLGFGTPPDLETREIAAPEPPPAPPS
jgi:hypothetical protein